MDADRQANAVAVSASPNSCVALRLSRERSCIDFVFGFCKHSPRSPKEGIIMRTHHLLTAAVAAASLALVSPVQAETRVLQTLIETRLLEDNKASDIGIEYGGWIQGSVTYAFDKSNGDIETRVFDFEDQDPTLNQVAFFVDKQLDTEKSFDIGGRLEMIWGGDARFTASNGLFDDDEDTQEQFDLTQLYVDLVLIPGENSLTLRAGKFITPLGYELVNPEANAFYSHNLLFLLVPYSHTGVLLTYQASENLSVFGGISRGWDQSLEDNNDAIDFIGGGTFAFSEATEAILSFTTGPEYADDNSHYKTAINLILSHQLSDQIFIAGEATYIYDSNQGQNGDAANTYGVGAWIGYTLTDEVTLNGRASWLNDTSRVDGFDTNVYEATVGVDIRPFVSDEIGKGLRFRPELRGDYAQDSIFDDGDDNLQFTAAIDAIFSY